MTARRARSSSADDENGAPQERGSKFKMSKRFKRRSATAEAVRSFSEDRAPSGSDSDDEGSRSRGVGDERRSKSSLDVRGEGDNSPPVSKGKKMWNSFKNSARKLRSRSRDKLQRRKREESYTQSQPDISNSDGHSGNQDFEPLFDTADKRSRHLEGLENGERSFSDPSMVRTSDQNGVLDRSEEKESEVDSGINVVDHSEGSSQRARESIFRAHPFFQMDVVLKEGRDLVIRDSCGTSDPYVKFKIGGKQYFKSRIVYKNLNPKWEEKFTLPIEDPFKPVSVKVFDYDRGLNDDPMGSAEIMPTSLELNKSTELKLNLVEKVGKMKSEYMGYLIVQCTLIPKTQDEKEQYFKKTMKLGEQAKKLKTQIWSGVVTIVLVDGTNLLPMDDNGFSDPYVKFRLGNEKYKSKYKPKTLNPRWLEQFDLHMYEDQTSQLELSVWDHDTAGKDDIMGRAVIDLSTLSRETTHQINQPLEDGAGFIKMMLTISGTATGESISDLSNYHPNPREREDVVRKYGLLNSTKNLKDIGWLQVKVIKAQGLAAADIGGKSDPFCVLELVNDRLQTQTEYKTLCPEWGKVFTFQVKDIHSVLEVTVYDEDRDKKSEFLGKLAIPLLRIRNGERRWFAVKDKKLGMRAKGAIQLEFDFIYNHLKAAIRTVNPREEKYMEAEPKFKIAVMKRNIDRVSKIAEAGVETGKFIQSCFDWESKIRSATAFLVFLIIVWNFELYMLPVTLLIIFFKNLLVVHIVGNLMKDTEDEYVDDEDDEDEEEKEKDLEEKKSFKEKLQQIQDVCLQVQEGMDMVASMGERVKNTFNWTVPWLSWLAVIALTAGAIILYYVPLRYLLIAAGVNKFTKKLRAPNAIPNNELLDFLSRVPSDKELVMYRELRPDPGIGSMKKKRSS